MRRAYLILAGLLFLAVLAQFYFAAIGAFAKPQDDKSYALHSLTGLVIVQMLILMLGGHDNDHTTPAGLSILGLHALSGLAILGVSGLILRRARLLARQQRRGSSGSPQAFGSGNATTETRRFRTPR